MSVSGNNDEPLVQPAGTDPVGRLPEHIAGTLAYVTVIPAFFFLLQKRYNSNVFIRFHSIQSILLGVVWIPFWIGLCVLVPIAGRSSVLLWPLC